MGFASSIILGDALALSAAGEIAKGFSRICVFSYSFGSANSLMRAVGRALSAFGDIENGFSFRSDSPTPFSRAVANSLVRLVAKIYKIIKYLFIQVMNFSKTAD